MKRRTNDIYLDSVSNTSVTVTLLKEGGKSVWKPAKYLQSSKSLPNDLTVFCRNKPLKIMYVLKCCLSVCCFRELFLILKVRSNNGRAIYNRTKLHFISLNYLDPPKTKIISI